MLDGDGADRVFHVCPSGFNCVANRVDISDLAITQDGFEAQGRHVAALRRPTVVLQEGGYDIDAIGENVRRFLSGLIPDPD